MVIDIIMQVTFFAASIIVAWYFAYLQMNTKLEKILAREYIGILTKDQAMALLKLYLAEMKRELNREIDDYCDNHINDLLSSGVNQSTEIRLKNALETRYQKVRDDASNKFSRFTIAHSKNFMDFITQVDRTALSETKKGIIIAAAQHLSKTQAGQSQNIQALKELLSAQMTQANAHGMLVFEQALHHWYDKQ